jgi:hypothetical protein
MYEYTVPQFTKMLRNLNAQMDLAKQFAEQKKFDTEVYCQARIAPDMFNFVRQVQIACDSAKLCVERLSGKDSPKFDDTEKTFAELQSRIEKTVAYLNTVKAEDFKGAEERKVTTPRWEGKWLTGKDYLQQHSIPNFYFHLSMAYALLRHNGVDVGKKNFLGEMPYRH